MRIRILTTIMLSALMLATAGCAAPGAQEIATPTETTDAEDDSQTIDSADTIAEPEEEQQEEQLEEQETEQPGPLAKFPASDMSGYRGLQDYEKDLVFVDMTVRDMADLMEEQKTFAVMATCANCPWCNVVVDNINDAALEAGMQVGYIDTRKDPSWSSNLDLEDYDLFTELVGDRLEYDAENRLHLYVPHIFFIKEGEVVHDYQGALPEMGDDPDMELTKEQEEKLTEIYREGFRMMEE